MKFYELSTKAGEVVKSSDVVVSCASFSPPWALLRWVRHAGRSPASGGDLLARETSDGHWHIVTSGAGVIDRSVLIGAGVSRHAARELLRGR